MKTTLITLGTAALIGLGALAPATSATAAPLAPAAAAIADAGVTKVGGKHGQGHGHGHGHRHRWHGGGIWIGPYHGGGYGGCYLKTFKVWDPYFGGYVIKKQRFCDHWRW